MWYLKRLIIFGVLAAAALLLFLLLWGSPDVIHGTEVCRVCGAECDVTLKGGVAVRRSIHPTLLSSVLSKDGVVPPHPHEWLFSAGAPETGGCALGPGRRLWSTVHSDKASAFFGDLSRFASPKAAEAYVHVALDPDHAITLTNALDFSGYPENGFTDAAAFNSWWQTNQKDLDQLLPPTP